MRRLELLDQCLAPQPRLLHREPRLLHLDAARRHPLLGADTALIEGAHLLIGFLELIARAGELRLRPVALPQVLLQRRFQGGNGCIPLRQRLLELAALSGQPCMLLP